MEDKQRHLQLVASVSKRDWGLLAWSHKRLVHLAAQEGLGNSWPWLCTKPPNPQVQTMSWTLSLLAWASCKGRLCECSSSKLPSLLPETCFLPSFRLGLRAPCYETRQRPLSTSLLFFTVCQKQSPPGSKSNFLQATSVLNVSGLLRTRCTGASLKFLHLFACHLLHCVFHAY